MPVTSHREVVILPDAPTITRRAADIFVSSAITAVKDKGTFTVALAGGSTPKSLYSLLAEDPDYRAKMPWDKSQFFFGDERHVPPDHANSNYRMANESLFSKAPIKREQIRRMHGEYPDTERAALEYEQVLRAYFKLGDGQYPRFDLLLLGMGDEGHTLSLFPGTTALHPGNRIVARNWVGKLYTERITMTAPAANNAAQIIFVARGAEKAPALKAVLEGPYEPEQLPSQLIHPSDGNLLWLIDPAAGSMLSPETVDARP